MHYQPSDVLLMRSPVTRRGGGEMKGHRYEVLPFPPSTPC